MPSLQQIASASAHKVAAAIAEAGLAAPEGEIVGMAVVEERGIRAVVSITRCDGRARCCLPSPAPSETAPQGPCKDEGGRTKDENGRDSSFILPPSSLELPDLERKIMEVVTDKPASVKALMRRAGYGCYSYFAAGVRRLLTSGLLIRVPCGVRLAPRR